MKRAAFALALLACSRASDPWVGHYVGSETTRGVDCTTGAVAVGPETAAITLELMRNSSDELFFAARCPVRFSASTDAFATIVAGQTCHTSLTDGTPVDISFTSGQLARSGTHLAASYTAHAVTSSSCTDITTMVEADR